MSIPSGTNATQWPQSQEGRLRWEHAKAGETTLRLAAVGDLQLSASIQRSILERGPAWAFGNTLEILHAADLRFGHLEFLFTREFKSAASHSEPFTGARSETNTALTEARFDVLSLATNHATDWGVEAIETTQALLRENGIRYAGAGKTAREAEEPLVIEKNGLRLGFLAFCKPGAFTTRNDRPGAAEIDRETVLSAVRRLRDKVDFVVVSLHWGVEFCPYPRPEDRRLALEVIDAGAAAILGHHPHVSQGVEIYRDRPIFYSLGSFLFNPLDERAVVPDHMQYRRLSLIADIAFSRDGVRSVRVVPVRFGEDERLAALSGADADWACDHLARISRDAAQGAIAFSETAVGNLLKRELKNCVILWRRDGFRFVWRLIRDLKWQHFRLLAGFVAAKVIRVFGRGSAAGK